MRGDLPEERSLRFELLVEFELGRGRINNFFQDKTVFVQALREPLYVRSMFKLEVAQLHIVFIRVGRCCQYIYAQTSCAKGQASCHKP